jgi:hypothetical protein
VLILGVFAIGMDTLLITRWQSLQTSGNQFLTQHVMGSRGTYTTLDLTLKTVLGAAVFNGAFVGSIFYLFLGGHRRPPSSPETRTDLAVADGSSRSPAPWKCTSCGEENPDSFDTCWKCQNARV